MAQNRRQFLGAAVSGAATVGLSSLGFPAIAQGTTKIRVGYLHTLAVDGQMWLADHLGAWKKNGLDPEFRQFTTGLELFQAMVGGSIDMLSTGAVISNFPARGQGKMFMCNGVEFATAQLWVNPAISVLSVVVSCGSTLPTTSTSVATRCSTAVPTTTGVGPKLA